jgi:transposase InsO family protein
MSDKPEPKQSKKDRSANSSRAGNSSPTQENQEVENHPSAAKSSSKNSRVVINPTIISSQEVKVLRTLCYDNISACEEFIRSSNLTTQESLPINTWIPETNQFLIEQKMISLEIPNYDEWRSLPYLEGLFPILKQIYPANTKSGSAATPIEKVVDLKPHFSQINVWREQTLNTCVVKMREIFNATNAQALDTQDVIAVIKKVYENMVDKAKPNKFATRLHDLMRQEAPQTLTDFVKAYCKFYFQQSAHAVAFQQIVDFDLSTLGNQPRNNNNNYKAANNTKPQTNNAHKSEGTTNSLVTGEPCFGCGRVHAKECALRNHPDRNQESVPWAQSTKGKAWAAKEGKPVPVLPWHQTLSGSPWDYPPIPEKKKGGENTNKKRPASAVSNFVSNKKGRNHIHLFTLNELENVNTIYNKNNDSSHTIPVLIQVEKSSDTNANVTIPARALIDTGAVHNNYINFELANKLQQHGALAQNTSVVVCSAFGKCDKSVKKMTIDLILQINECNCNKERITCECTIIESPYEIIIGRPTIIANGLLDKLKWHFQIKEPNLVYSARHEATQPSVTQLASLYQNTLSSAGYKRESMKKYIDYDSDDGNEVELNTSRDDPFSPDRVEIHEQIPHQIYGTPEQQHNIKLLCEEFKDIFSTKLRPQPADIPAYEIVCDLSKWQINQNRLPARVQSHAKQAETIRQINDMLANNVIKKSQATAYSQILLVPKPNNKLRLVVDYRNLNKCCEKPGWPIPNIKLMLQRIGAHVPRPQVFGKIDYTSGYHQAGMALVSQFLTAFITIMGVFEWLRVPMGLIGAPSYFQQVIATVVLAGLLYVTCELYIDDVLIHAPTHEIFMIRLREIFVRFRKHKITVNPEKCLLGLEEVEFVGHLINGKGIHFTRSRLDSVLEIPLPTHEKGLKKFLGVANYFRDHIHHHSELVRPLQQLVVNYTPSRRIIWTKEAEDAFANIKEAINNCPSLSFMHESAPVYLHTDASDYGIGAYLFQLVDGVEQPVAFMSKSLNERESKWSTPEKECYAIYYSLVKFEHLLRDITFCIRTDHKNLTYLNNSANEKVNRWKMKIQNYSFDIEYIPGEQNIIADAFSRLISFKEEYVSNLEEVELLCILDELKLDTITYTKISAVHNSKSGHFGVERTVHKLQAKGENFAYMRQKVRKFIKQCPCCQKMSVLKVPIHTHPFTTAAYQPMERLNVDTIGPFEPDDSGNTYIITIIDCFTRWVELYAVKDTTAISAANVLLLHMGRFGIPTQILSDNGSQFVNDIITEFTKLVGTEHVKTLAYSKEENAIVERANKEALRHLRAMVFDENIVHIWSTCLPFIQRIINSTIESSIGATPASILFGNSISLDRGIFLPLGERRTGNVAIAVSDWTSKMLTAQSAVIAAAEINQIQKDESHIGNFDPQRTEFINDSYVLVEYATTSLKKGPPNKLQTYLRGPLKVVSHRGSTYVLENLVTGKLENCHITQLRPFTYDETRVDPTNIANHDQFVTPVESIVTHSPIKNSYRGVKCSELFFTVRWKDLPPENDRILPYKELRNNPALHKYLAEHKMKSYIPAEHKKK